MTYGDQAFRYGGDGFQEGRGYAAEPEPAAPAFHAEPPDPDESYPSPPDSTSRFGLPRRMVTPAELDDVFDDPNVGDPGMDRMTVHIWLETALLVATTGVAAMYYNNYRTGISGDGLRGLLLAAATLGFLTLATALTLQVGAVNLAIGPVAIASSVFFAQHSHQGLISAATLTVAMAAGVAGLIGLLTVALQVPPWASSLAGALGVIVWINKQHNVPPATTGYQPAQHAFYWYGGFVALVLLGGFLGLVKPLRRNLSRYRPVADPALRRGAFAGIIAVVASVVAGLLSGLAGIIGLLAAVPLPPDGLTLTGLALAAALVGGTSAFGRRSGIFGILLAATLLALGRGYSRAANLRISDYALAAGGIVAGLVVTRLVEKFGRPYSVRKPLTPAGGDGWAEEPPLEEPVADYQPPRQGGWTSQLPARSNDDTWGGSLDGRWGAR